MNNAKKLMGLALLLNILSFGSAFGLGIKVINTFNNPYTSADGASWDDYQRDAVKTICVNFGSKLDQTCTRIEPINSSEKNEKNFPLAGTPSKLFVSTVRLGQKNHQPHALVFDLDAARKQFGKLSINTIYVVTGPEGVEYITLNDNPAFKVMGQPAMAR